MLTGQELAILYGNQAGRSARGLYHQAKRLGNTLKKYNLDTQMAKEKDQKAFEEMQQKRQNLIKKDRAERLAKQKELNNSQKIRTLEQENKMRKMLKDRGVPDNEVKKYISEHRKNEALNRQKAENTLSFGNKMNEINKMGFGPKNTEGRVQAGQDMFSKHSQKIASEGPKLGNGNFSNVGDYLSAHPKATQPKTGKPNVTSPKKSKPVGFKNRGIGNMPKQSSPSVPKVGDTAKELDSPVVKKLMS